MFKKGSKKDLEYEDIYDILPDDRSKELGDRLAEEWEAEVEKCRFQTQKIKTECSDVKFEQECGPKRPSLFKALARIFFCRWAVIGIFLFIEECIAK